MTTEKKIGRIKEELQAAEDTSLPFFIEEYEPDTRAGVQKLVEQAKKRLQKVLWVLWDLLSKRVTK